MKRQIERLLAGLFVFGTIGVCVWATMNRPRILVLSSYDLDYGWCRDETIGLKRILEHKRRYTIRWHYMDAKRHPWKDYLVGAGTQAGAMIREWRPDVIIGMDDEAHAYAVKNYANDPHIQIVFAGINGEVTPYGYDKATNATGIFERFPLDAVRDAVLDAAGSEPRTRPIRLMSLCDQSEAAEMDEQFLRAFDWKPLELANSRAVRTFPQWQGAIRLAEGHADYILLGNYRQLARSLEDRTLVPARDVVEWTEANTKVPVIGLKQSYAEEGGMLTIAASGYEQGETAARMAVSLIDEGKRPKELPFAYPRMFLVSMRGSLLKARNIKLPSLYEAAARAAGKYYD
jgi:hypothetical protein